MENKRVVEFLVGMMFLVLVFIMILIGIGNISSEKHVTYNHIQNIDNSQKTYIENTYEVKNKVYFKEKEYVYLERDWDFRDYDSWGNHKKSEDLGLYTDTYEVKVKNNRESKYFEVHFYLEDFWGRDKIVKMRKYIPSGEEKIFYYREINDGRDTYSGWMYDVLD